MRKLAVTVTLFSLFAGIAGYFLRTDELLYVFDPKTGLPERGAATTTGLILLTVFFLITVSVFSFLTLRRKKPATGFSNTFNSNSDIYPVFFVLLALLWAVGTLLHLLFLMETETLYSIDILFIALSLLPAACIAFFAIGVYHKSRGNAPYIMSIIPSVFMCFWLILLYRQNAANPILLSYVYQSLAIVSAALSFYYTSGFVCEKPSTGKAIVAYSSAIYFCCITMADNHGLGINLIFLAVIISSAAYLTLLLWNIKNRKDIEKLELAEEVYNLYRKVLPGIYRDEDTVRKLLVSKNVRIVDYKADKKLVGFSLIHNNAIYLLCVDTDYQKKGIGTKLLKQSEKIIRANGYSSVILGAGKDYIMPGVPMKNNAHMFFIKNGYTHSWGDTGCVDMSMELSGFDYSLHKPGDTVKYVTYRWAEPEDYDNIYQCVLNAEENFAEFYENKELYDSSSNTKILIAERKQRVVGVLMVINSKYNDGIGSLAALATAPDMRGKGIATMLMHLGTKALKDKGLRTSYLSYTYTDIVGLYSKVGYWVCMEYFMGKKNL